MFSSFGDNELTPLPEEFSAIFGFPTMNAAAIPDMSPGLHNQFERLLGLSKLEVTSMLDGRTVDLILVIKKFALPLDDVAVRRYKRRALCLCLLHRYLLVNSRGHRGDASLISIVEQLEQDRTTMPLIMEETLLALDRMKQNPRAPLDGSPLLLMIWLQEHLFLVHSPPNPQNYNIRSFANRRKCNMQTSFEDWNRFLGTYGEPSVRWTMPWLKLTEVTVAPYRHNHVRLISSRTTYIFPCRVMSQLGRRQLIPNDDTHPLNSEAQLPHLLDTWVEHGSNAPR